VEGTDLSGIGSMATKFWCGLSSLLPRTQ
jgi:hypothetical protein